MAQDKTLVYITVDVECAEERVSAKGTQPPLDYDVRVFGRFTNQKQPLGLQLIVDELAQYGHRGTFFVEAIGANYFGADGLREVCGFLLDHGQDVQLHLHPVQRKANWNTRGEARVSDNIADYCLEDQVRLLCEGRMLLEQAGVPSDQIVGYRAGNFGANNHVWHAMQLARLRVSSNYNPCYFSKHCQMRYPAAELGLFETPAHGVWELPITNFVEPRGNFKHLQITAVSLEEMKYCLKAYRAMGVREVTIVTHSFEFYFLDSIAKQTAHKNLVNIRRLRGLCRFLHDHASEFQVDTVGALGRRLEQGVVPAQTAIKPWDTPPRMKPWLYAGRVVEQGYKRLAQRLPLD